MYKIDYLSLAKKDMEEIVDYISHKLNNKKAALNLIEEFKKQEKNIISFPYGSSEYQTIKPLKYKYRKVNVNNFYMFYTINEDSKIITVSRVLYQKRDIKRFLK